MKRPLAVLMLCSVLSVACATSVEPSGVVGSGNVIGEARDVGTFTSIEAADGVDVFFRADATSEQHLVVVHYDDNLQDLIGTEVRDETLHIDVTESYTVDGGGRFVTIQVPEIVAVSASGGASVTGEGEASAIEITASGGADVDVHAIYTATVDVNASGGADVKVFATDSASVIAEGGAGVVVFGEPAETSVTESGGATVEIRTGDPGDSTA